MTIVEQMADFAAVAFKESLSDCARMQLKIRMLDSLGCAIGALEADPMLRVRRYVTEFAQYGRCSLIGGGRSSPDRAALMNGGLVRYLDFNDSYLAPHETCHPSDNLGAVLAASELADTDGATLLTALGVAYQVQCRLSDAAPVRDRGFDHTTLLAYSAAAGVARALSLDGAHTANAIAISGAALNALRVTRTGTLSHWKGLAAPFTASAAVQAALLAQRGITGPAEVFEGSKGFMQSIAGPFEIDWSNEKLDRVEGTIVKRYDAEIHSQTAIEAALELQHAHGFRADQIEKIDVDVFDVAHDIIGGGAAGDKTLIFSKEDADHSLPYLIAVAFLDHAVMPDQFTADRINRADVQELLCRVAVHSVADFSQRFPAEMPSRVSVVLTDGQMLTRTLGDYPGFRSRPATWEDAVAKFNVLGSAHADDGVLEQIADCVLAMEHRRVVDLTRLLRDLGKPAVNGARNAA
jgi:2-methylcitrate dehydratase